MPISRSTTSPYNSDVLQTWSYCSSFAVDLEAKTIRLTYATYADKASAYAGKPPISRRTMLVAGADFDAILAANQQAFGLIKAAADSHALSRPEFAGGEVVE